MNTETIADGCNIAPAFRESNQVERLIEELSGIRADMVNLERSVGEKQLGLNAAQIESARNLVHYMSLRRRDIRELQDRLAALGLSSLGRAEAHVMNNVDALLGVLHRLSDASGLWQPQSESALGLVEGNELLKAHAEALLGEKPAHRNVRIMVTMPSEAADDYQLVHKLVAHGMNCMRINCAYDNPEAWSRMITNLRRAMKQTGKDCRVLMDLAGPKLRTGPVESGPRVIKWRPLRDQYGQVKTPALIWLCPSLNLLQLPANADACLPLPSGWLKHLKRGDLIKFFDARGASRQMTVVKTTDEGCWAESLQTSYVATGTTLHAFRSSKQGAEGLVGIACMVGELPAQEQRIYLNVGDELVLTRSTKPGRPAVYNEWGHLSSPARIGITLPEIFDDVREGERVLLDDGKMAGVIKVITPDEISVEMTHTPPGGGKLRADKGANLPDSNLRLPALTEKDCEDLAFIALHADLVGYSFVRSAADVCALQARLAELGGERLGIVLKIETNKAFENLPNLLLAAMHSPCAGVMIARGDLAVECGYERMAEVQEEILWICEAAHMPVIWATQVLENLAKDGQPSRAEITDAAMGERAECVMLNKGPYIVQALQALDDILQRMQAHQSKKRSMLRHLKLADQFNRFDEVAVSKQSLTPDSTPQRLTS